MRLHESRTMCLFLSLILVVQPIVECGQRVPTQEPSPEELAKIADEMEKAFDALAAAAKEIPRDTFDPQAIVDHVGRDPVKLFEWVRDNTFWVPYQGALRGPTGVLMDRLGNSLDRALLLAKLLQVAGHEVRLARVDLSEGQAQALLPKLRPVPPEPLLRPAGTTKEETRTSIDKYVESFGLNGAASIETLEKLAAQSAKLVGNITERVAEQAPLILSAIGVPDEGTLNAQRARESAGQLEALRDHWWVQTNGASGWTNLDPLLPDHRAGTALAEASETIDPNPATGTLQLDGQDCHEVVINVVIEQSSDGGLQEKVALAHTLRPFELFGQRIALQYAPMNCPKDLDLLKEKDPLEKLKATVLAEHEWVPLLTIGPDVIIQNSFTDTGDLKTALRNQLVSGVDEGVARLDPFGRFGQPKAEVQPPETNSLTALWIDFEIRSPGQGSRTIRRQIFDLLGPAARADLQRTNRNITLEQGLERGLALMGESEMLVSVATTSQEFVDSLVADKMLANRASLSAAVHDLYTMNFQDYIAQAAQFADMPSVLYDLALARAEFGQFPNDVYLDSPNIFCHHLSIRNKPAGPWIYCSSIDIVANDVAVRQDSSADPFFAQLQQGILETNAEMLLMPEEGNDDNAADLYSRSQSKGIEWEVIRTAEQAERRLAKLSLDSRQRICDEISAGYVVLAPTAPLTVESRDRVAWWRIDPATGQTLGIGDQGWGQDSSERQMTEAEVNAILMVNTIFTHRLLMGIFNGTLMVITRSSYRAAVVGGLAAIIAALIGGYYVGHASGVADQRAAEARRRGNTTPEG